MLFVVGFVLSFVVCDVTVVVRCLLFVGVYGLFVVCRFHVVYFL